MKIGKLKYFIPALVWGAVILIVSSIPDLSIPSAKITMLDKVAHFGEYFVLGFLLSYGFSKIDSKKRSLIWIPVLISTIYAILDESHQLLIPGREAELLDILADFIGAVAAGFAYIYLKRRRE